MPRSSQQKDDFSDSDDNVSEISFDESIVSTYTAPAKQVAAPVPPAPVQRPVAPLPPLDQTVSQ